MVTARPTLQGMGRADLHDISDLLFAVLGPVDHLAAIEVLQVAVASTRKLLLADLHLEVAGQGSQSGGMVQVRHLQGRRDGVEVHGEEA